jgi:protein phosphatase
VFHVGDSRVYRWHGGALKQLTTDHSVVQELLDAGYISDESATTHPQRHIITRALGVGPRPEADVVLLTVVPGERFLACSDGLTGELPDERIAELLSTGGTPDALASNLTAEAEERGARDNVTVALVQLCGPAADMQR